MDLSVDGNHVLVQTHPVHMRIPPVHIGLAVIVDEHGRVDVLPVLLLPHERMPERILEGPERRICHQDADSMPVDGAVHVKLAATLHVM